MEVGGAAARTSLSESDLFFDESPLERDLIFVESPQERHFL